MAVVAFDYCNRTLAHPEVQRMMKEEHFDLVLTSAIGGRMLTGLATHFQCPLAYVIPVRTPLIMGSFVGNPLQISSVPTLISTLRSPMGFADRVRNLISAAFELTLFTFLDVIEGIYYRSNFKAPAFPSYNTAKTNASLILAAHHFSQGAVANVPQIVEIGGIQMDLKLAPLPEKLQSYLDAAEDGVIFLSFGTNLKLKKLNQEKLWAILRALGKTNMKVLMKYDAEEEIPGLPENILTSSWLPQREVLGE